ncbi:ser/Thr protein phosphatase family protein [Phyllosticta citriasiana]|uniref:Ser/Thr protein phosphatase family protein n=2 Tax=Phyllosticta citriasiana TaxID=595635 RepID=A0ABR1KQI9_9PEZI
MITPIQQSLRRGSKLFSLRQLRSNLGERSSRATDNSNTASTVTHTYTTMAAPCKPQGTIKTRILIISDTHSAPLQPSTGAGAAAAGDNNSYARAFQSPLPAADVLLHCGDLTMIGHLDEYRGALDMLGAVDAPLKLVIAGNHDISLDGQFYHGMSKGVDKSNGKRMHRDDFDEKMPDQAAEMWKGELARKAGVTYLEEGLHEFELGNGARLKIYSSPYQPEFYNWAFAYDHHEDRFNPPNLPPTSLPPNSKPYKNIAVTPVPELPAARSIDVFMTHGPPLRRLDRTATGLDVGCPHLLRAAERARPRLYCFGHIHEGWGAERVCWSGEEKDAGVKEVERVQVDDAEAVKRHAALADVSSEGGRPLRAGEETLMVNASIMDLGYSPSNAPWLVELDLPKA